MAAPVAPVQSGVQVLGALAAAVGDPGRVEGIQLAAGGPDVDLAAGAVAVTAGDELIHQLSVVALQSGVHIAPPTAHPTAKAYSLPELRDPM